MSLKETFVCDNCGQEHESEDGLIVGNIGRYGNCGNRNNVHFCDMKCLAAWLEVRNGAVFDAADGRDTHPEKQVLTMYAYYDEVKE